MVKELKERIEQDREVVLKGFAAILSLLKDGHLPFPETYERYFKECGSDYEDFVSLLKESSSVIQELLSTLPPEASRGVEELVRRAQSCLGKLQGYSKSISLSLELFRDHLTGLWNRRALEYYFNRVVKGSVIERPWSLSFIDLNGFKQINDTYGHLEGDRVLKEFASFLSSNFPGEFVCRYGGDEFVVVCGNLNLMAVRKRFSELLESSPVPFAVGITNIVAADDLNSALVRADLGMYRSKKTKKVEYVRR